ncbi:MAG: Aspartate aminotransferase [Alphaproteobacteria bacterium ADurb.Bin438]|nr:MAG: Aspartate aminotransferase [Alphaproteobacteria bacterium ADurb.Bin438]
MGIIAERISFIKPSPTLAISSKAKELKAMGRDIISLSVGEPDFTVPDYIKDAAKKAIDNNDSRYTLTPGTVEVRKAIKDKLLRENGLEYSVDEITVNCGGKHSIFNVFMATIDKDDEVIIPAPYWVSYPDVVKLFEGKCVMVDCHAKDNFKLSPKDLENAITDKTKWLILNSPSNPTGAAYTKSELKALAEVLLKHPHVWVMTDDIYEHIVYDDFEFANIIQTEPKLKSRGVIINGMSKAFAMPGWRIGYAAGPLDLIKAVNKLQSQSTSHAASICQTASAVGLNGDMSFLQERNKAFKERRDFIVAELNKAKGVQCLTPEGAFYVYPLIEGLIGKKTKEGKVINNDSDFAEFLLEEKGVAIVPGVAFGLSPYVRLSYACSLDVLKEASKRILEFCESLS